MLFVFGCDVRVVDIIGWIKKFALMYWCVMDKDETCRLVVALSWGFGAKTRLLYSPRNHMNFISETVVS